MTDKKTEKIEIRDFPFMIAVRNKAVVHAYLASFDNANSRLCQERLFRSGNFATMVTRHRASPLNSEV